MFLCCLGTYYSMVESNPSVLAHYILILVYKQDIIRYIIQGIIRYIIQGIN